MLQGIPCNWFISSQLLPIYLFWHTVIFEIPQLNSLWQGLHSKFEPVLDMLLAFGRGFSLAFGMDNFRNHPTHSALTKEAYLSQFIIGILSSCGSSLTLNWMISAWNIKKDKEEQEDIHKKKPKQVKLLKHDQQVKQEWTLYPHPGIDLNICASISFINLVLSQPHLLYKLIDIIPNSNILESYLETFGFYKTTKITREESGVYCALLMMASVIYKRSIS